MRPIDADALIDEMIKIPGNRWNTKTFGEALGRVPTILPRLLPLSEAVTRPVVWAEWKDGGMDVHRVREVSMEPGMVMMMSFDRPTQFLRAGECGRVWRCWDREPEDGQREAEAWTID